MRPTGFLFKTEEVRGLDAQSKAFLIPCNSGIVLWTYNDNTVNILNRSSKGCDRFW